MTGTEVLTGRFVTARLAGRLPANCMLPVRMAASPDERGRAVAVALAPLASPSSPAAGAPVGCADGVGGEGDAA